MTRLAASAALLFAAVLSHGLVAATTPSTQQTSQTTQASKQPATATAPAASSPTATSTTTTQASTPTTPGASTQQVAHGNTPTTAPTTNVAMPLPLPPAPPTIAADARPVQNVSVPEDGQWLMAAKNYQQTRYSGLDQINRENVKNLRVAWTFSTGVNRGQEFAPLVVGDTMYVVTPFPNVLYALDLKPESRGRMKWSYDPKPEAAAQGVACCDVVNRGAVYHDNKIIYNTLDCHVVAVDATNGKEVWKSKVGDINIGETMTMAPIVVKGKVLVGNSGGEFGVRGWLRALDANSGKILWTAWSTGPDSDVLIGEQYNPYYSAERGKDLGVTSWPPGHWKIGGGNVWGWVSYDPELDLVYYGTGNAGGWNHELRPGNNKFTAGVFARRPDDGQAVWFYQYTPHDLYDHDEINEHILLDLTIDGRPRKVAVHPGRNGFMYVLDRATGQVLSAAPFSRNTAAKGVDLASGQLMPEEKKKPVMGKTVRDVQPAPPGAKDWQPCAWSPRTQLLYIPHQNLSCDFETTEAGYIAGTPYVGANVKMYAGPDDPQHAGYYTAWDVAAAKPVWRKKEKFPVWSGTIATAGDVVFYGTMQGDFKALDARTGEDLWRFKCGSGIIGQPVTYKGPDGKQYVAILSGVGGWAGAIVAAGLDATDPTAALGFANAMKELPSHTTKGGTLYVFELP